MLILVGSFSACQSDDEKICDNFEKHGISNKEALIGEWKFDAFGYTVNGEKIKEKEKIKKGDISFFESGKCTLFYINSFLGEYNITGINEITVIGNFVTLVNDREEELEKEEDIADCFLNSICYKIENNKLYIHTKKINNHNVLILKKK
jgi:heat shock protein HslJ